ncbi:hypothetical protein YC2023_095977 [Brassica napus]
MATSGTYVTEVPLKGTVEKHYKKWRSENHAFPEAIGHHIQNVIIHDGEWDSHGAIKTWNYTCDGKPEVFKERREIDDEKKTVTFRGLEGHVMEQLKVYDVILEFIPKSEDGCVCKITMIWEKRNDEFPEPSNYMKFVKSMVADMDDHVYCVGCDPGSLPSFEMMALFGCKARVLRGPACTINDLFDRDIDRKVERTRLRPLASGLLTPFQGIQFLGLQLLLLLGILLQLNNYSRVLGALSLLLNFSYPLMTRFTHWPRAFLGFTINWGALLGWAEGKPLRFVDTPFKALTD